MQVGQIVYCEPGINMKRIYKDEILKGVVEKIGNKYVYININGRKKNITKIH